MPNENAELLPTQTNTEGATDAKSTEANAATSPESLIGGATDEEVKTDADAKTKESESLIGDTKSEEETKTAETDGDGEKKPEGAPEKYEPFAFPEGVVVDEQLVDGFMPIAKELNLSQAQAQKLVDFQAAQLKAIDTRMEQNLKSQIQTWHDEAKKDPNLQANLALCRKFVDHLKDPDVNAAICGSWMGSHPAIVKALAAAGKLISEDTLLDGGVKGKPEKAAANKIYPNMK